MNSFSENFQTDHPVALVTGSGAPRVGDTVLRKLAKMGCRVVVHANSSMERAKETVAELKQAGVEAIALQADLTNADQAARLIDQTCEAFGRIDILVNAAAIWKRIPLEETTAADMREHFEANTLGTWVCAKTAGLRMVEQPTGGAIINIGDWAIVRPYENYAAYFPSKGAIPALTKSLAVELGQRNNKIRVNAVLPGPVMIPDSTPDEERLATIRATLLKTEGSAEHIAHAVVFLAENSFVTGVCLPIDGGRSIFHDCGENSSPTH